MQVTQVPVIAGTIDAGNSTTTTLGSSATFTGTAASSLQSQTISVAVFADQAGTLLVDQSQDGTHWDTTDSYAVTASAGAAFPFQIELSNYRVRYTNGSTAQGAFRLQTIRWPLDQTMPRTLTALGNLKVAVQEPTTLSVKDQRSSTGTQTSVAASASSVTVLASNANRLGATVYNDSSTATLYLLLSSGTASTSAYSIQLSPGGFYEIPFSYTGQLTGIWSAAVGNARVTELT